MHPSAYKFGELFFKCYFKEGFKVAEIGSQNVNGSIRDFVPENECYTGVDFVEGEGVDVVLEDPYQLPFENEFFDMVVTSSCFEHSSFFWLSFLEILRILKPAGVIYLNVPSNGYIHRYPLDCWRFYPDSGIALEKWGQRNGYDVKLLESFVGAQLPESQCGDWGKASGRWNDFVAVFIKDTRFTSRYEKRMYLESNISVINCINESGKVQGKERYLTEDFEIIDRLSNKLEVVDAEVSDLMQKLDEQNAKYKKLQVVTNEKDKSLKDLTQNMNIQKSEHNKLKKVMKAKDVERDNLRRTNEEIFNSLTWKMTRPIRSLISFFIRKL